MTQNLPASGQLRLPTFGGTMFAQVRFVRRNCFFTFRNRGNELYVGITLIYDFNEQVHSRMAGGSSLHRLQLVRQRLIASFLTNCRWVVSQTTLLTALVRPFICGCRFSQFCAVP